MENDIVEPWYDHPWGAVFPIQLSLGKLQSVDVFLIFTHRIDPVGRVEQQRTPASSG